MSHTSKWVENFLGLARHVAQWSKDPSTKVGAVIVDEKRRVAGHGYNGFPRGVIDSDERYADRALKYPRVVHAEANAILNSRGSVEGCELYVTPLPPCPECTKLIIQAGIKRVVFEAPPPYLTATTWHEQWILSQEMLHEAGVEVSEIFRR